MLNLENWDFYHWKLATDAETRHHFSRGTRIVLSTDGQLYFCNS